MVADQRRIDGVPARWWLEEDRDHPVLPATLRKQSAAPNYPELCLDAFSRFIAVEHGELILEGAAFQSTVRFMFANAREPAEIGRYIDCWCRVVMPAQPRLIYLTTREPKRHFEDIVQVRGAGWTQKLIAYVERTPVAQSQRWSGFEGFVAFWETYQDLCLDLLGRMTIPVSRQPAKFGAPEDLREAALSHFVIST